MEEKSCFSQQKKTKFLVLWKKCKPTKWNLHRAFSVFLYNSKGEMLFAKELLKISFSQSMD